LLARAQAGGHGEEYQRGFDMDLRGLKFASQS
jgi:hypothetical protein